MSENSSELDMFETGRRSSGGDDIERIRAETARLNAEAEKIKAENERQAAQNASARSKSLEEEELTKWEYTREDVDNIQKMNQLGAQGWELVGTTDGSHHDGIFKRKIRSQQNQTNGYGRGW
ncbi:MAG: hypothetical protein K6A42_03975 [Treponema sp.]|nr:hypothetical protein [Treponema sp.]